jgi:hypothetical protein
MIDKRKTGMLRHRHQSTIAEQEQEHPVIGQNENNYLPGRSLQMLDQDRNDDSQFVCESLDVVDACRGTSVSYRYRGTFVPYDGPCDGGNKILDGYPIYKTASSGAKNEIPKFMYAIGVYSDTWSVESLRGLVRWRIVDFENFKDQTSCRTESANINQIDFAADGQPYNYWPTIYCFDADGNDQDGFKSSTINIRCNDQSPPRGYNGDGNSGSGSDSSSGSTPPTGGTGGTGPGEDDSNTALVLGIVLILAAVAFAAFVVYNRFFKRRKQKQKRKRHSGRSWSDGKAPTKGTGFATSIDSSDSDHKPTPKMAMILPSATPGTNLQQKQKQQRRPFSSNSIMADDTSSHSGSGGRRPASMITISKPYELLERKIAKKAPEPPKTPSPLSSPESSRAGDIIISSGKFTTTTTTTTKSNKDETGGNRNANNRMDNGNSSQAKKHEQQQSKQQEQQQPKQQEQRPQHHTEKTPKEQGREPSEKDSSEEGTFMSESLSNMFRDINKSLDEALSSDDEDDGKSTGQNKRRDPPEAKAPTRRIAPTSLKVGKHDEMNLSQRSKFMFARGKLSARGSAFDESGADELPQSRSFDNSQASKHTVAKNSLKPLHQRIGDGFLGKVDDLILGLSNHGGSNHGRSSNRQLHQRRSKSLDNTSANKYANAKRKVPAAAPRRSRSKERLGAENFSQRRTDKNNSRSKSKEGLRSNHYAEKNGRSRSRERSGANDYLSQGKINDGREGLSANNQASQQKDRSRSRERSGADAFVSRNTRRPKSKERSASNAFVAQKDTRRGRSKERSGANDYVSGKGRPRSLERSGANGYAQKNDGGQPSRSLERTPAAEYPTSSNNKRQPGTRDSGSGTPNTRSRSFDASKANHHAERERDSGAGETPKTRSRSFDSSSANNYAEKRSSGRPQTFRGGDQEVNRKIPSNRKLDSGNNNSSNNRITTTITPAPPKAASTTVTKNPDGTVVVARKRRREDGAMVTTKTKYASIYLARKHGIAV